LSVQRNGLRHTLDYEQDDDLIKRRFLMGTLSPGLLKKLHLLARHSKYPLAVRSSGLLEDSLSHPFAGLYSTFFLPNTKGFPKNTEVDMLLTFVNEAVAQRGGLGPQQGPAGIGATGGGGGGGGFGGNLFRARSAASRPPPTP
jgi:hypothetical protein